VNFLFFKIKTKLAETGQQYFTNLKSGAREDTLDTDIWFCCVVAMTTYIIS
jgi:hypothetical protein